MHRCKEGGVRSCNTKQESRGARSWNFSGEPRFSGHRELFFVLRPPCPVLRTWVIVLQHQCSVSRPTFPVSRQRCLCRKKQASCCRHLRRETEMRGPDAEHDGPESRPRVPTGRTRFPASQVYKLL
jgi:hypothetical protein